MFRLFVVQPDAPAKRWSFRKPKAKERGTATPFASLAYAQPRLCMCRRPLLCERLRLPYISLCRTLQSAPSTRIHPGFADVQLIDEVGDDGLPCPRTPHVPALAEKYSDCSKSEHSAPSAVGEQCAPSPHSAVEAAPLSLLEKCSEFDKTDPTLALDGSPLAVANRRMVGKMRYANGELYEGDWLSGKRHGFGTYLYSDGSEYEGDWKDDLVHGRGSCKFASGNR